jgi:GNAT superfamily N-acetyltransferase
MGFQQGRRASRSEFRTRAEVSVVNHQNKKELVDQGRAHCILVYANGEPIGWCQYGPSDELGGPIGTMPAPVETEATQRVWRVTCFVVDRKHRRKGVAGLALRAALESIRRQGGGIVEARPIASWSAGRDATPGVINTGTQPGFGCSCPTNRCRHQGATNAHQPGRARRCNSPPECRRPPRPR